LDAVAVVVVVVVVASKVLFWGWRMRWAAADIGVDVPLVVVGCALLTSWFLSLSLFFFFFVRTQPSRRRSYCGIGVALIQCGGITGDQDVRLLSCCVSAFCDPFCMFSGPEVSVSLAAGFIVLVLFLHLFGKLFR
jgi:hypothetical protein